MFRFDAVYYNRFKLNKYYLWEYHHIWRWMRDMMNLPGMELVSNAEYLQHCKQGYFGRTGNGTVPLGPPGYPECYKELHWSHRVCNSQATRRIDRWNFEMSDVNIWRVASSVFHKEPPDREVLTQTQMVGEAVA
jgi:hypothetical protein